MPRPKASARQQNIAYRLYKGGLVGPSAIWEALAAQFGDEGVVSLRTVNTWIRGFKDHADANVREGRPDLDVPFQWHRMEEYGLPWESSEFILRLWKVAQEHQHEVALELDRLAPLPTARQVRWWWRVHLAVPDTENILDVHYWAGEYVRLEIYQEVLGRASDLNGMDAYLAYRPWEDGESFNAYTRAVLEKRIPGLQNVWEDVIDADRVRDIAGEFSFSLSMLDPMRLDVLPSDNMQEALEILKAGAPR